MVDHVLTERKPQVIMIGTAGDSRNVVNAREANMTAMKTLLTVIVLALVGVGTGLAVNAYIRPEKGWIAPEIVPVTINNLRINVPSDYFRGGSAPRTNLSERIDLVIRHNGMAAAGLAPATTRDIAAHDPRELIFVAILRNDGVLDPADRPQDLYGRFLEPDAWQNPGGLLLRRFEAGSPYHDEELFIAPPDGKLFSARCRKTGKGAEATIGESCIWRFRHQGADLQVRFAPELLPQWETMTTGLQRLLDEWKTR
jgi:hypothetical protein